MTRAALRGCLAMISLLGCGGSVSSGDSSHATNPGSTIGVDNESPNADTDNADFDTGALQSTSVIATPHNLQVKSSGYCLRAAALPLASGVSLVQDVCSDASLVFVERAVGSGLAINVDGTSFCINVASTTPADLNGLTLDLCDQADHQSYSAKTYDDGSRAFNAINTGLCLDQLNASTTIGDVLGLWTCNDNAPQKFLASGPATSAGNVGNAKKFHPGWGIRYDGMAWSQERDARYALYDHVRNDASIKAAVLMIPWIQLEPTKGNYDFAEIDAEIAYLESMGKRVALEIVRSNTKLETSPERFPQWVHDEGRCLEWRQPGGPGTYQFTTWKITDSYCADRYIAAMVALGKQYDSNPNVEMLIYDETGTLEGVDWLRILRESNAAWPTTITMLYLNWIDNTALGKQLLEYQRDTGNGIGSSDIIPPPREDHGSRILRGAGTDYIFQNNQSAGKWDFGSTDYRGQLPVAYCYEQLFDMSLATVLPYAEEELRPNYLFISVNASATSGEFSLDEGSLPAKASFPNLIRTACPTDMTCTQ